MVGSFKRARGDARVNSNVCMYGWMCTAGTYIYSYRCTRRRQPRVLRLCASVFCAFRARVQTVQQGEAHEMKQAPFAVKGKGG
jgi:hypothetical protein